MLQLIRAASLTTDIASQLHAVWMAAYTQEAVLLGARDFPPLRRSQRDLLEAGEVAVLAYLNGELAGGVVVQGEPTAGSLHINALVVAPRLQRLGVAYALLSKVIEDHPDAIYEVTTGAANTPVLALYHRLGFKETGRMHVGRERLVLVSLMRAVDQRKESPSEDKKVRREI